MPLLRFHREPAPRSAMGVHDDGRALHAALLRREGAEPFVAAHGSQPYADAAARGDAWTRLRTRLTPDPANTPVAITLPAGQVLHRALDLPRADDATVAKMIATQLETVLPGQCEQLRWGWARAGDDERVWVGAARAAALQDAVARVTGEHDAGLMAVSLPVAMGAWADQRSRASGQVAGLILLLHADDTQTAVTLLEQGRLRATRTVDAGRADFGSDQPDGWASMMTDALAAIAAEHGIGGASLVILGDPPSAAVRDALAARFDLVRAPATPTDPSPLAVGAAAAALEPRLWPIIGADLGRPATVSAERLRRPLLLAAGWLLAALAGLVFIDLRAAGGVQATRAAYPTLAADSAALQRELNLAKALEARGPTLLAIVDEMTALHPAFPTSVRYDADQRIELRGTLDSPGSIGQFVTRLAGARTLSSVQLHNQKRVGDEQVEYEIFGFPRTPFFEAFAEMPAVKPDAPPSSDPAPPGEAPRGETLAEGGPARPDTPATSDTTAP